jgi:ABC-2 type transport system permease protein
MSKVLLLTRRELSAYFVSPVAYVAMALFLVIAGFFFALADFRPGAPAAMRSIFEVMMVILVFVVPIVTMRSLSEERRTGTLESLLTAPVTDWQIVLAKFLAVLAFFGILVSPTLAYVFLLTRYSLSTPDYGLIAGGYVGLGFMACLYFSLGLFISSLTRSQIVAAIISFVCFVTLGIMFSYWSERYSVIGGGLLRPDSAQEQRRTQGVHPAHEAVDYPPNVVHLLQQLADRHRRLVC